MPTPARATWQRPGFSPIGLLLASAVLEPAAGAEDPCECLKWSEVYASKQAVCGEGLELYMFGQKKEGFDFGEIDWLSKNMAALMKEFCYDFFHRIDSNLCIRVSQSPPGDELNAGSWCYVSSQCTELQGGHKVSDKQMKWFGFWPTEVKRNISVKVCQAGKDKRLQDMDPFQLKEFSFNGRLMLGLVFLQAYPKAFAPHEGNMELNGIILNDFIQAWKAGDKSKLPDQVRNAMSSQAPLVINEQRDFHGNQALIWGDRMLHADFRMIKDDQVPGGLRLQCPETMACLDENPCKFGCKRQADEL